MIRERERENTWEYRHKEPAQISYTNDEERRFKEKRKRW